jgi:hypothetical protein
MALLRKQRDLNKEHTRPRVIKDGLPVEKRKQPRFTSQFRSIISGEQGEGRGRTLDLSTSGCMVETDLPVSVGASIECRIYVPGLDWPLRIDEAQVRWVKANTFGIQFTKIQPDEEAKLKQVIAGLDEEVKA